MSAKDLNKRWVLQLYVAGMTSAAQRALTNINTICADHLEGRYSLEVIDLLERPTMAESEEIFAVPTLVRQFPLPLCKIIGDLSNTEKVFAGLDIRPDE